MKRFEKIDLISNKFIMVMKTIAPTKFSDCRSRQSSQVKVRLVRSLTQMHEVTLVLDQVWKNLVCVQTF